MVYHNFTPLRKSITQLIIEMAMATILYTFFFYGSIVNVLIIVFLFVLIPSILTFKLFCVLYATNIIFLILTFASGGYYFSFLHKKLISLSYQEYHDREGGTPEMFENSIKRGEISLI